MTDKTISFTATQFNTQLAFFLSSANGDHPEHDESITIRYVRIEDARPECDPSYTYTVSSAQPTDVWFSPNSTASGTYTWSFGDGSPTFHSSGPVSIHHHYSSGGTYSVGLAITGVGHLGCSMYSNLCLDDGPIHTEPYTDEGEFINTPHDPQGCNADFSYTINTAIPNTVNLSPVTYSSTNYNWSFGDGTFAATVNPYLSHIYTQPGSYKICYTANAGSGQHGCSKCMTACVGGFGDDGGHYHGEKRTMGKIGTNGAESPLFIKIAPNPAQNYLTVTSEGGHGQVHLELLDAMGNVLSARAYPSGDQVITLDMSKFPTGIYLLKVSDGTSSVKEKVIKE